MIEHVIASLSLAIATVVDIKIREVPDTVSYGTIFLAIVIATFNALAQSSFAPIFTMFLGATLCFAIGGVMFYAGQWGGGDFKLIIGLGALFGATPFLYAFLILTVFAGAFYGIFYGTFLAIRRRKEFHKSFIEITRKKQVKLTRFIFQIVVVCALLAAFFLIEDIFLRIFIVTISAGSYLVFYAWIFSRALESCMIVKTAVTKLVEGDWIVGQVFAEKKVLKKSKGSKEDWAPAAYGVTKAQIEELSKANVDHVMVKEGIPFVPSFTLAYIGVFVCSYFASHLFFL